LILLVLEEKELVPVGDLKYISHITTVATMLAVILPSVTVTEYYVKVSNQKYSINIVLKSYSLKRFHLNLCILLVSKEKELVPVGNHKYTGRMKN